VENEFGNGELSEEVAKNVTIYIFIYIICNAS
jgi:hypothetical protein